MLTTGLQRTTEEQVRPCLAPNLGKNAKLLSVTSPSAEDETLEDDGRAGQTVLGTKPDETNTEL
jgi:hypothetical protein